MDNEPQVIKVETEPPRSLSGIVIMTLGLAVTLAAIVIAAKYANPPPAPAPSVQTTPSQTTPSP